MSRSYGEPVQVRQQEREQERDPSAFLWHGRLYVVRQVLAHWYERRAWWAEEVTSPTALGQDREIWRVEASAGRQAGSGVYDLCRTPVGADPWRLLRVAD